MSGGAAAQGRGHVVAGRLAELEGDAEGLLIGEERRWRRRRGGGGGQPALCSH